MVFVPMAKAPPKAGAKLLYNLNLIHEFTSLNSPKMIYAPSRPVLPFCPFWLHTFICLNSAENFIAG